jgi:hypothetical protein
MVMGNNRIYNFKKCRQIDYNFNPHATEAIQRGVHCLMERIHGFVQSH